MIRLLVNIANNDPAELFDNNDNLKKVREMPIEMRKALRKFKVIESWSKDADFPDIVKDVAVCDRIRAIELLMKFKGMLIERRHHTGEIDHNVKSGVLRLPQPVDKDTWIEMAKDWSSTLKETWAMAEGNGDNSD